MVFKKTATVVLAVLLLASLVSQWRTAKSSEQSASDAATKTDSELTALRSAVSDTQAYLNWYRMNQDDGLTREHFESNLVILRNKYVHHFPEWARNSP